MTARWSCSERSGSEPGRGPLTSNHIVSALYLSLWIVLVASSLTLRRLPRGKIASLGLAWMAIILSLWALIIVAQKWL